jgi:hypothetical protein
VAVRRLALAAGAVAVAAAVGIALGWQQRSRPEPPARPVTATASLSQRTLSFADPLTAHVDVLVDPRQVDPATVRLNARFGTWRIVSAGVRTRTAGGVLLSYHYSLECLVPGCLPGRTLAERRFLPALLSYRTAAGRLTRRAVDWPTYTVVSHLSTPDIGDPTTRLRADAPLPPVSYRIAPGTLQALLAALSALLVLAAAGLVVLALPRRGERRRPAVAPLEQALALVRASTTNGYPAERRKALGVLARALRAEGQRDLAQSAVRLAWSADPPTAHAANDFADHVEEAL